MNRDFKVKIENEEECFADFIAQTERIDQGIIPEKTVENLQAANLARLLAPAEAESAEGRTRPAVDFLKEFKRVRDIQGAPPA
ncbi:MAG: hypothetical protein CVU69_09240 [Deltaproteobacteria bacterium HGW-Deltaproteobacteria-4]|nr:MAG: hypothetical protein CVU69_09240 [Deltaproteobacteria bacterium HGW-Deltaproteobacteria-4]